MPGAIGPGTVCFHLFVGHWILVIVDDLLIQHPVKLGKGRHLEASKLSEHNPPMNDLCSRATFDCGMLHMCLSFQQNIQIIAVHLVIGS